MIATHIAAVVTTAVSALCSTLEIGIAARGNEKARSIDFAPRIEFAPPEIALFVDWNIRIPMTRNAGKFSIPRSTSSSSAKMT